MRSGFTMVFVLLILMCPFLYCQEVPALDTFRLNTGLKVYFLQYGEDSVLNVRLVMNDGKQNENACQTGYSEIIQKLLDQQFQGAGKRRFTCTMKTEQTVLQGNCSMRDFDWEIGILNNTIVRLSFEKESLDRIVSKMVDRYKKENLSVWDLSEIYKDQVLYGTKNPMGRKYCQYQIEKVLPVELREFYVRYYTPENSSLIICGNFNSGKVKKIIKKHFVKWRPLRKVEKSVEKNVLMMQKFHGKEISMVNSFATEKYLLKWILPGPAAQSIDLPAFAVLCKLFDRYLLKTAEENGLLDLNFRPIQFKSGYMSINCFSERNDLNGVVSFFEKALEDFVKKEIDEQELKEVMAELNMLYRKQKDSKQILQFYDPLLYDFEVRKNYLVTLSAITPQRLQKVLQTYFISDVYKLIVVGKSHLVAQDLQKFGKLSTYQTSDFETCDESCKEIVIIKYHCESCRRRGLGYVWRFNPADKEAIERARARKE